MTVSEKEEEDWLDTNFLAYFESQADESVTLEAVRSALTKFPGSMVCSRLRVGLQCEFMSYASRTAGSERISIIGTGVSSRIAAMSSSAVTFCRRASGRRIMR